MYSAEIRERHTPVHKVVISFSAIQFVCGVILVGLSASLKTVVNNAKEYDGDYSDSVDFVDLWDFFLLQMELGIAYAVPLLILGIGGILAYGFLNKAAVIVHTVFNSIAIVYGLICVIVPALESAIISTVCAIIEDSNPTASEDKLDNILCNDLKSRANGITVLIAINIIFCFVLAILGCIAATQIRRTVHSDMAHSPSIQAQGSYSPPQYVIPGQQNYQYPPPPSGQYPPQSGYPAYPPPQV